jgi:hypothetical protein
MNQGAQGYSLTKKTEGRKSRVTVSLTMYPDLLKALRLHKKKPLLNHEYSKIQKDKQKRCRTFFFYPVAPTKA